MLGSWDLPGGSVVKTGLSMHGAGVQSLVGALRSHMPHHTEKRKMQGSYLEDLEAWAVITGIP